MANDEPRPVSGRAPLDQNEIAAILGATMMFVGVFCPVLTYGKQRSLLEAANTIGAILIAMVAMTAWLSMMRRAHSVRYVGVLSLVIIVSYGFAVWFDLVRVPPQETIFGPLVAQFSPTAWIVLAAAAVMVTWAGNRSETLDSRRESQRDEPDLLLPLAVVLATYCCLYAVAMTNPFGHFMGNPELRWLRREYREALDLIRWILLAMSSIAVLVTFQSPKTSSRVLWIMLVTTSIVIGDSLLIWTCSAPPWIVVCPAIWTAGCIALLNFGSIRNARPFVFGAPVAVLAVICLCSRRFGTVCTVFGPPSITLIAAYSICHRPEWRVAASSVAVLFLGIPSALMAVKGIPNEFLDACGVALPEGRVLLLGLVGVLVWSLVLSFRQENEGASEV